MGNKTWRRSSAIAACALVVVSACERSAADHAKHVRIGANGGVATSDDGLLTITVPPGAVDHDIDLTIEKVNDPTTVAVSPVYALGPDGTQFTRPIGLGMLVDTARIAGRRPEGLSIASLSGTTWAAVASDAVLDPGTGTLTMRGRTTHLSIWSMIYASDCATSADCKEPFQCVTGVGCAIPCRGDDECPRPTFCIRGLCLSKPCSGDEDCARGGASAGLAGTTCEKSSAPPGQPGFCADTCDIARSCPARSFQEDCTVSNVCALCNCVRDEDCERDPVLGERRCAEGVCFPARIGCRCGEDQGCPCAVGNRARCPAGVCDLELQTGCPSGTHCCLSDDGTPTCQPVGDKKEAELCPDGTHCGAGLICVGESLEQPRAEWHCRRLCCGHNSDACPSDQVCGDFVFHNGTGACQPKASRKPAPPTAICMGEPGKAYCCNDNRRCTDPWWVAQGFCSRPPAACGDNDACTFGCAGCYDPKTEKCCSSVQYTWTCPADHDCVFDTWCGVPGHPEQGFAAKNVVTN